ncbi:MAG: MarR family winged helix-turn-helix transcriptional regulator [Bacteroidia bacterium]
MKTAAISILEKLLPQLEDFLQQANSMTEAEYYPQFLLYLFEQNLENKQAETPPKSGFTPMEVSISQGVVKLYKYAKGYIKKGLEGSLIQGAEDFGYMVVLFFHGEMTKTQLIQENISEPTSGIDVIKRLINIGLIEEFENPSDKRSKKICLTEKGKNETTKMLPIMMQTAHLISGKLTLHEKIQLMQLIQKLETFHADWKSTYKNANWEENWGAFSQ